MKLKKNIIGICGSASDNSANLSILKHLAELGKPDFNLDLIDNLSELPHFRTELTDKNVPKKISLLRDKIVKADGIIICTPEYVFSIPSGLKNMIEWCISTTVFSEKPIGLITASTSGLKGHEELKLIMETIQTIFVDDTTLLIQGVKGKVTKEGKVTHKDTRNELIKFVEHFDNLLNNHTN